MLFIKSFLELFSPNISQESINLVFSSLKHKRIPKNEILIKKGELPSKFYIIKTGLIRSFVIDKQKKEHTKNIFVPVDITGPLTSLIKNRPSNTFYECLTDCEVLEGDYNEFLALTQKHHEIALFHAKILEKVFLVTDSRVSELSSLTSIERYLKAKDKIPNIDNLIAQYHIASYINVTPVQLSRLRKKLYAKAEIINI